MKFLRQLSFVFIFIPTSSFALSNEILIQYKEGKSKTDHAKKDFYSILGLELVSEYEGPVSKFETLKVSTESSLKRVIETLKKDESIEFVEPNYVIPVPKVYHRSASNRLVQNKWKRPFWCVFNWVRVYFVSYCKPPDVLSRPADVVPPATDSFINLVEGLTLIGTIDAWFTQRGSQQVVVAHIDTGVDYNHEDLRYNIWRNPSIGSEHNSIGYNFMDDGVTYNDHLPYDDVGHGTHTAGIIGAVGGNGIGISGVAQRVSIMPIKFLNRKGGTLAGAVASLNYAVDHGARIINCSWGHPSFSGSKILESAIDNTRQRGVLLVIAAGNEGFDMDGPSKTYPGSSTSDNVISVAATDNQDKLAGFSNRGKHVVHLAAPGIDVLSTYPGDEYRRLSGTSMAAPMVSGAAALIWSKHPYWNYQQVKQVILSTVDPLPVFGDYLITGGRLNIKRAIQR